MDLPAIERPEPDQLFSDLRSSEPPESGLLNERHADSALFDLRELETAPKRSATGIQDAKAGSGLISVDEIVAADAEEPAQALSIASATPGSLVAEVRARGPVPYEVPPAPTDKLQRHFLIAGVLALICVAILLASTAFG